MIRKENGYHGEQAYLYIRLSTDFTDTLPMKELKNYIEGVYLKPMKGTQLLLTAYTYNTEYIVVYLESYSLLQFALSGTDSFNLIVNVRLGNNQNQNLVRSHVNREDYTISFRGMKPIYFSSQDYYSFHCSFTPTQKYPSENLDVSAEVSPNTLEPDLYVRLKCWSVKENCLTMSWLVEKTTLPMPYEIIGLQFKKIKEKITYHYDSNSDFEIMIHPTDDAGNQLSSGYFQLYITIKTSEREQTIVAKTLSPYPLLQKEYVLSMKYLVVEGKVFRFSFYLLPNHQIRCMIKEDGGRGMIKQIFYERTSLQIVGTFSPSIDYLESPNGASLMNQEKEEVLKIALTFERCENEIRYLLEIPYHRLTLLEEGQYQIVLKFLHHNQPLLLPINNNLNTTAKKSRCYCSREWELSSDHGQVNLLYLLYENDILTMNIRNKENGVPN